MKILKRLAKLLSEFPVKSIFITVLLVVLLVVGLQNVYMATGNDTLVKSNSDVYQDNEMLEEEFGGESVIVLYESDHLLTPDHLEHMKGLENALLTTDSIYSMISPVTLVEEIANKQAGSFQEGILEIIDGLSDMGSQLSEIGLNLKDRAEGSLEVDFPELGDLQIPEMENPELPEFDGLVLPELGKNSLPELQLPNFGEIQVPDMEGKMTELDTAFSGMIEAQENLGAGTESLIGGYAQFGEQLNGLGENLLALTGQMEYSTEKVQIKEASQKIIGLSQQMSNISEDTEQLPVIPNQTINGLNNIQQKLSEQLQEQKHMLEEQQEIQVQMQTDLQKQQERIKEEMQEQQRVQEEEMKEKMLKQQERQEEEIKQRMQAQEETQKSEMKAQMEKQKSEKEQEIQELKNEMQEKQAEQGDMLGTLGEGLTTMGENLQSISENMETIYGYSDIMTPGLPDKQTTLDNMVYDDGELRTMFQEVVVDDQHMIMMIKFNADTNDEEKSAVVDTIRTYLDNKSMDSIETIVSGKPVLDNGIRSSMQESIQKMMGLALLIMVIVLFFVFKVRWFLLPLFTVLIAVIGTVGLMGWLQIPITMVSMAVFPILIGLGIDYAIQFQNRYEEELAKEDWNE